MPPEDAQRAPVERLRLVDPILRVQQRRQRRDGDRDVAVIGARRAFLHRQALARERLAERGADRAPRRRRAGRSGTAAPRRSAGRGTCTASRRFARAHPRTPSSARSRRTPAPGRGPRPSAASSRRACHMTEAIRRVRRRGDADRLAGGDRPGSPGSARRRAGASCSTAVPAAQSASVPSLRATAYSARSSRPSTSTCSSQRGPADQDARAVARDAGRRVDVVAAGVPARDAWRSRRRCQRDGKNREPNASNCAKHF